MNGHQSSNNPDNSPFPVATHTKSHQLPFNSCWDVCVLHNLPPNTNHITRYHLELSYQFSAPSNFLSRNPLVALFENSHNAIFTMCSHTFTLFWSRNISVIVEIFQITFCVLVCVFSLKISSSIHIIKQSPPPRLSAHEKLENCCTAFMRFSPIDRVILPENTGI